MIGDPATRQCRPVQAAETAWTSVRSVETIDRRLTAATEMGRSRRIPAIAMNPGQ
jgi:hypothetical protein